MGNLFLGFPVARAKIADMISTSAPPSLHKTQHQLGGTDEINCTGLTGAGGGGGGIGSVYQYGSTFESTTGYAITTTGSATASVTSDGLTLKTGSTLSSVSTAGKNIYYPSETHNFNNAIALMANVNLECQTTNIGETKLLIGRENNYEHIGFKIVDGILYGTTGNGTSESTVALETLGISTYNLPRQLIATLTPSVKCEFYSNGILLGTITTNLPSSVPSVNYTFYASVDNTGTTNKVNIYIHNYNIQIAI